MTTRTDTERLDWFEVPGNRNAVRFTTESPGGVPWQTRDGQGFQTFRQAVDAAMDTAASKELDEAWKAVRENHWQVLWSVNGKDWHIRKNTDWQLTDSVLGRGFCQDDAILAAYRASKGA